ncbi:MAG TPA: alanine racemase [Ktedonobacteraceae bacterium]|nr:alanine racemase [Ktedonobacteraceae bacterium]
MIYLDHLLSATSGTLLHAGKHTRFDTFNQDTRQLMPGELYVAVRGEHGDGHDYLLEAARRGAAGLLIEGYAVNALSDELRAGLEQAGVTTIVVEDTRVALQQYARAILRRWHPTVIAVTGSVGKTSTKEAIAAALSGNFATFKSWQNYNDALGLPLSLGRLEERHEYAVLELGCDHPGEMQQLCQMIQPTIGVLTNISPAQLQYFGTLERLAEEYSALLTMLPAEGVAIVNGDDEIIGNLVKRCAASVINFRPSLAQDINMTWDGVGTRLIASTSSSEDAIDRVPTVRLSSHLLGRHHIATLLAAYTVGKRCGLELADMQPALASLYPMPGRLNPLAGIHGARLLDDTHNAAPASVIAALETLQALPSGQRIAVLGDMLRLGDYAQEAHRVVGQKAAECIDYLVMRGEYASVVAEAARKAGLPENHIIITSTHDDAAQAVERILNQGNQPGDRELGDQDQDEREPGGNQGDQDWDDHKGGNKGDRELGVDQGDREGRPYYTTKRPAIPVQGTGGACPRPGPGRPAVVLIKGSEETRMERVTEKLMAQPEQAREWLVRQTPGWKQIAIMRPARPTWVEIDLSAIAQNTQHIAALVGPRVRVLASLKADAYGHGAVKVAHTVLHNGADMLGVATVSEAMPLREAGVNAPILVFGYVPPWQMREAVRLGLTVTLYSLEAAQALSRAALALQKTAITHVKVDTGMGRLGIRAEQIDEIVELVKVIRELPRLELEGIFTHFALADALDKTHARMQLARFQNVLQVLEEEGIRPQLAHAANSAAMFTMPEARLDMVRPGIALYGLHPSMDVRLPASFRPALSFKTQVSQVKLIPAGECLGYGCAYYTEQPTTIAVLPVGYADGFRRAPTNWGSVLIHGLEAPLVGRICMDQCMVDVSHIPQTRAGDEVVLIGRQGNASLTAEQVAQRLGTINYEVVSEILARVPRVD